MTENWNMPFPEALSEIRRATEARMASDELTGSLLRGLAASKGSFDERGNKVR
jgi:hypothetical protein